MAIVFRFLRRWPLLLLFAVVLAASGSARAALVEGATRRVALVVGNSEYRSVAPLKNASRDSTEIAKTLTSLGFEVIDRTDVTRAEFQAALDAFYASSAGADAAVIFYSGHGFQMNGINYLVPVDATLRDRSRIGEETLRLDQIAARADGGNRQTLIFLDACRNNPLPEAVRPRYDQEGLAQLETGSGTFIAFATQPGNITRDGAGQHSPFTSALLQHMPTPGISISDMMIRVRNSVEVATLQTQTPWDQSSLRSQFYFNPEVEDEAGGELTAEDREMLLALDPAMRRKFEAKFGIRIARNEAPVEDVPARAAEIRPMLRIEASDEEARVDPVEGISTGDPSILTPTSLAGSLDPADPAVTTSSVAATLRILPGASADDAQTFASLQAEAPMTPSAPGVRFGPVASALPPRSTSLSASLGRAALEAKFASPAMPEGLSPAAESGTTAAVVEGGSSYEIAALSSSERSVGLDGAGLDAAAGLSRGGSESTAIVGLEDGETVPAAPGADEMATKGMRLAALDPVEIDGLAGGPLDRPDDATVQAAPAPAVEPPSDIPAAVQTELARLGCYRSAVDGEWGSGSARALLRYYASKKLDPDILEPNAVLHARLTGEGAVVCTRTETRPAVAARSQRQTPATARVSRPETPKAPARTVATRRAVPEAPAKREAAATAVPGKSLRKSMTLGAFR